MLPPAGAVIGIDVGCSAKRASSAICRLEWDLSAIRWTIARFRAVEPERSDIIRTVAAQMRIIAAAIDGPLRSGLDEIGSYRTAERMLTRRLQPLIGKPGQSSSPVGRLLNRHANSCATALLEYAKIEKATHQISIHDRAIVEAFPSAFLGLMLDDPLALNAKRGDRSDAYFLALVANGGFAALLGRFLRHRKIVHSISEVRNHDDRAAFVCALTALCIAAGQFTAVGDADGWIILPPRTMISAWGWSSLTINAADEQRSALYVSRSTTAKNGAAGLRRASLWLSTLKRTARRVFRSEGSS